MKDINKWTRKEFEALPTREWNQDIGEFDSLIILPLRKMHHSGYRMMDFVAVRGKTPICLLSGCSDLINIDGTGGLGKDWLSKIGSNNIIMPKGWCIDCLGTSGLLRLFSSHKLYAGDALSSFDIYSEKSTIVNKN